MADVLSTALGVFVVVLTPMDGPVDGPVDGPLVDNKGVVMVVAVGEGVGGGGCLSLGGVEGAVVVVVVVVEVFGAEIPKDSPKDHPLAPGELVLEACTEGGSRARVRIENGRGDGDLVLESVAGMPREVTGGGTMDRIERGFGEFVSVGCPEETVVGIIFPPRVSG